MSLRLPDYRTPSNSDDKTGAGAASVDVASPVTIGVGDDPDSAVVKVLEATPNSAAKIAQNSLGGAPVGQAVVDTVLGDHVGSVDHVRAGAVGGVPKRPNKGPVGQLGNGGLLFIGCRALLLVDGRRSSRQRPVKWNQW